MTTEFFDLMIDTETAGLPPTGALMSIGAVFFDLKTRTMGPTFNRSIHLATSVREGGTIDASTFLWWLGQSDAARGAVRYGGLDIRKALQEFSDWIAETCPHSEVRVWGNSPSFDMVIVGGAYKRCEMPTPWSWYHERDFRTVRAMYPAIEYDVKAKGDGAHNALADAQFQVEHLFKIADRNKKGSE